MLTGPLPVWDLERRHVEVAPLVAWVVATIRMVHPHVPVDVELAQLHRYVSCDEALHLSHHLTLHSRATQPQRIVHALLRDALGSGLRAQWDAGDVVVQAAAHIRVLTPGDTTSPAHAHTDHAIGHGLDERNVWIALTAAARSSALHVLPLASSLAAEQRRMRAKTIRVHDDDARRAQPIAVRRGDVLLFTPVHVHGARAIDVDEDATRVSVDVRIAPAALPRSGAGFSFVLPREVPNITEEFTMTSWWRRRPASERGSQGARPTRLLDQSGKIPSDVDVCPLEARNAAEEFST